MMSLSKLLKSGWVVVVPVPFEIQTGRYDSVAEAEEDIEEMEDEDTGETGEAGDTAEPDGGGAAEKKPAYVSPEEAAKIREETERKLRSEQKMNQEALINNFKQAFENHSSRVQEKILGLIGDEIIAQARRTAELIVSHTLETTKFEMTNVIAQGYADGFAEGKNEALSVIEPALAKIAALLESVLKVQDLMLDNFRHGIFSIISEISSKIIHKEISSGDEYLMELFNDAVKSIKVEEFVTVTVSDSQVDFVVRNTDIFKSAVSNIADFKIVSEKDASRGTMIVETAKTIADASYYVQEEKIDEIIEQMKDTLIIPQSAEEIAELEKIRRMREENLDYLNMQEYQNSENPETPENLENLENIENLENLENIDGQISDSDSENPENLSDINIAGV